MILPSYVLEVMKILQDHDREAFIVGGCVRDLLMGHEPDDYDVVTSATTPEIISWFPKTVLVGERYGTVAVLVGSGMIEVSTFKELQDAKPDEIQGLERDLLLRDFTIDAMAMDELGAIFDPAGGRHDIEDKIVRAPGNLAQERFLEDPLRMLRAVRFYSTLGFALHPTVYEEIKNNADLLSRVAIERVRGELDHILISDRPAQGFFLLAETGLLENFLPEAAGMVHFDQRNFRHDKDLFEHTLAVVEAVPPRIKVRLAALLHDIGKTVTFTVDEKGVGHFYGHHQEGAKMAERILRRLKYDRQTVVDVSILVQEHMSRFANLRDANLKKLVVRVGEHNLDDLFELQKADIMGSAPPFIFSDLEAMQARIIQVLREKPPLAVKDLQISGDDLIAMGIEPGPLLGRVLNALLEVILEDPDKNQRDVLLKLAAECLNTFTGKGHPVSGLFPVRRG